MNSAKKNCISRNEIVETLKLSKVMTLQITSLIVLLYVLTPGYSVAGGEFSGDDEEGTDKSKIVW